MKRLLVILTAALMAATFLFQPTVQRAVALTSDHTPVVLVHGYNDRIGTCQGIDLTSYWSHTTDELLDYVGKASTEVIPVSYYGCDAHGVDITGSGPGTDFPLTVQVGTERPRAGYNNDASITQIAHDLAWFIHNEISGPVYAVGHSMGGLVIREALRRVEAGDPDFPPSLDISRVMTFSTPHAGWEQNCTQNQECREMTKGSQFLADLATNAAPQGASGTVWWGVGTTGNFLGSPCDIITSTSATAVAGTAVIYTSPCYRHNGYLTDLKQTLDAQGTGPINGLHSLALMGQLVG